MLEILKKDSSKLIKTLGVPDFYWQDGYGLFSVSPSHFEAVRKYILDQEEHHKKESSGRISADSEKIPSAVR